MNVIKSLRNKVQATQQEFAQKVGTSQSTIAAYESGAKSPTLKTVKRFASAFGFDINIQFASSMTREDRRSLAFHVAIAEILESDVQGTITHAKANLLKLRKLHPGAHGLLKSWQIWLNLPAEDLKTLMLSTSFSAREMRQVSPFSGLLKPNERALILSRFRKELVA